MNDFAVQLKAALVGNLDAEIAKGRTRVAGSARAAISATAIKLQGQLRQDVVSSQLARGGDLQKTWRHKLYPKDKVETLEPAALVYSTMPAVVLAFERGARIVVHGKKGVLVPNYEVWGGRIARPAGRGAKSVSTFAIGVRKYGALQWIATPKSRNTVGVFVAKLDKKLGRTGNRRRAGKVALRKGRVENVVVFWVVREARLPRLLRGDVIRRRAEQWIPGHMQREFSAALAASERGQLAIAGGEGE